MKTGNVNKNRAVILAALVAIASFAVYGNSLFNGFVYDDKFMVLGNKWIRDTRYIGEIFSTHVWGFNPDTSSNYYRPLMHMLLMADYHVFGLKAFGYHLTNLVLHAANSVMVFVLALQLFERAAPPESPPERGGYPAALVFAFLAGVFFAVHPVHVEAVAWVSVMQDLAAGFLYLLALTLYVARDGWGGKARAAGLAASALAFGTALFFKEISITLLAVLVLFDIAFGKLRVRRLPGYVPFAAAAGVYFVVRAVVLGMIVPQKQNTYLSAFQYVYNVFPLFARYMRLLVYPARLNAFYVFHPAVSFTDARVLLSLCVAAALLAVILYSLRSARVIFFSLGFLALGLGPALYLPGVGTHGSVFAERYLYLPSVGFVIALAYLLWRLYRRLKAPSYRRSFAVVVAVLIVAASLLTIERNRVWHDNYTLWSDTARKTKDSAVVYNNLGAAADKRGRVVEAINAYNSALALSPYMPEVYFNLGVLYSIHGDVDKSIESYEKARGLTTNYDYLARIAGNLGDAYLEKGMLDRAIGEYSRALELGLNKEKVYFNLGVAYGRKGMAGKAIQNFETVLGMDPENRPARMNIERLRRGRK